MNIATLLEKLIVKKYYANKEDIENKLNVFYAMSKISDEEYSNLTLKVEEVYAVVEDTEEVADKLIRKLLGLRIFADENGKTNLSLTDVNGELLIVSQFTLCADCKKGNRPSFTKAGNPEKANALYEYVLSACREKIAVTESGVFGADMRVDLSNDGPFTILFDSCEM